MFSLSKQKISRVQEGFLDADVQLLSAADVSASGKKEFRDLFRSAEPVPGETIRKTGNRLKQGIPAF